MKYEFILLATCLSSLACDPDLPAMEGSCETSDDCTEGDVCEERKEMKAGKFCYDSAPVGGNTGGNPPDGTTGAPDTPGDTNTAMPIPPSFSGFSTIGGRRTDSSGKFAIYDEGFEGGPRLCSNDKQFCVTGSFTP